MNQLKVGLVRIGLGMALTFIAGTALADGASVRILRSEALNPATRIVPETAPDAPQGAASLSFFAYGRQFDLDLQPNRRLLNRLPAAQKRAVASSELYRGRLRGRPGTWVRVTRVGKELYGAIWDGTELYAIEPTRSVARFSWKPLDRSSSNPRVYRLSDVESPGVRYCGLAPEEKAAQRKTALADYREMVGELTAQATVSGLKQIEIAVLGDVQFANSFSDPSATALARMNIVDGIFTEQMGVIILVPEVRIFTSANNPFTTSTPKDLLSQLADYRNDNASMRSRGITHLMTGRNLDGDTAGIAYLGSVCDTRRAVSLSEGWRTLMDSALIAAHEIGHNFGAPHDGEEDSPCASTPQSYLMAPTLNGSQTFSQCSRTQMTTRIATASCIVAAQIADVSVSAPTTATAYQNEPFDYAIDVSSLETLAAENVTVTFSGGAFALDSATVTGGSCTSGAGVISCQLGSIPPETTRQIQLRLRAAQIGTYIGTIEAAASNDRSAANNRQTMQLRVLPRADLSLSVNPTSITAFVDEPLTYSATVTAIGVEAVTNASFRFDTGLTVTSATPDSGSCTISSGSVTCDFGALQPGATRQITIQATGSVAGSRTVTARVSANNDGDFSNNTRYIITVLKPNSDAGVRLDGPQTSGVIGEAMDVQLTVTSNGRQAATGIVVTNNAHASLVVESASLEGVACPLAANTFTCSIATLEAGATRRVTVRVRPTQAGHLPIQFSLTANNDQQPDNNSATLYIDAQYSVDSMLSGQNLVYMVETRTTSLYAVVSSLGRNAARNLKLTATLPPEVNATAARLDGGNCTIEDHVVTCTIQELQPHVGSSLNIELRGDVAGEYTAQLNLTADDEGAPANNSYPVQLRVREMIDIAVAGEQSEFATVTDRPFDIALHVTTGIRPVQGARLVISVPSGYVGIDSVDLPAGSCTLSAAQAVCELGDLAANTNLRVVARAHSLRSGFSSAISATVSAATDVDGANNYASMLITAVAATEISLAGNAATLSATANQNFTYALDLKITGNAPSGNVTVDVPLPAGMSFVSANGAGFCSQKTGGFDCVLGNLAADSTARISTTLRASTAGSYSLTATATTLNDTDQQNNSHTTTITVSAAPSTPTSGGSGGGKGGGGSLGWLMLFGLATLLGGRHAKAGVSRAQ